MEEGRDGRKEGKTFPSKKTSEGEEKRPASLESKQSRGGPRINVAADRQNGGKKEKGKLLVDVTDKKYPQTTFARLCVQKQSGIAPEKKIALYLNLKSVFFAPFGYDRASFFWPPFPLLHPPHRNFVEHHSRLQVEAKRGRMDTALSLNTERLHVIHVSSVFFWLAHVSVRKCAKVLQVGQKEMDKHDGGTFGFLIHE